MGVFSQPHLEQDGGGKRPLLIGVVLVLLVVVGILLYVRIHKPEATGQGPPLYTESLQLSDLKLSAAENFVGGSVTYLDGTVSNLGGKTVVGAMVEVTFRDSLGQVVQKETLPLMLLENKPPYPDTFTLDKQPLTPNARHEFRLTFEHISSDWNHGYPELRFTKISAR